MPTRPGRVVLKIPLRPEFCGVARLTAAGLAARCGFREDETEDLKLAVTEGCTILFRRLSDFRFVQIEFFREKSSLALELRGLPAGKQPSSGETNARIPVELQLSFHVIKNLMDEAQLCFLPGGNLLLKMSKHSEDGALHA